jgi:hypothetical protein
LALTCGAPGQAALRAIFASSDRDSHDAVLASSGGQTGVNVCRPLKLLEIAVAASLPVVAAVHSPVWVTGGLTSVVVVLEGAQHLFQFQQNWITRRAVVGQLGAGSPPRNGLRIARAGGKPRAKPPRLTYGRGKEPPLVVAGAGALAPGMAGTRTMAMGEGDTNG